MVKVPSQKAGHRGIPGAFDFRYAEAQERPRVTIIAAFVIRVVRGALDSGHLVVQNNPGYTHDRKWKEGTPRFAGFGVVNQEFCRRPIVNRGYQAQSVVDMRKKVGLTAAREIKIEVDGF